MKRILTNLTVAVCVLALRCGAGEIHDAVLKHDLAAVERLLKKDALIVHARDFRDRKTPLYLAVQVADIAIVKRLLEAGADVNARDANGRTPFSRAALTVKEDTLDGFSAEIFSTAAQVRASGPFAAAPTQHTQGMKTILVTFAKVRTATVPEDIKARLDILALLLATKPDLKSKGPSGDTVLHHAAQFSSTAALKLLLDAGADANASTKDGATPLHFEAMIDDSARIELLIAHGAKLEATASKEVTPLMLAARAGARGNVEALLKAGAQIDAENIYSKPVIGFAAEGGHDDIVKLLYDKGGRPLIRDADKVKLFMCAAQGGSRFLAALLLDEGVDVNSRDEEGFTPLLTAVEHGHTEFARLLIEKGADRSARTNSGSGMLMLACQNGNAAFVKELLAETKDVEQPDEDGATLLSTAAFQGRREVVEMLLARGADVNPRIKISPLGCAIIGRAASKQAGRNGENVTEPGSETDYAKIAGLLIGRGAKTDVIFRGVEFNLIEMAAVGCGAEMMKVLVDAGLNFRAKNKAGVTPLHLAARGGRGETVALLLSRGAKADVTDSGGDQPLHFAATAGNTDAARVLIANRAPLAARGSYNATPLHRAVAGNHLDVARLLLQAGAPPDSLDAAGLTPLIGAVGERLVLAGLGNRKDEIENRKVSDSSIRLEMIRMLLEYGADKNFVAANGRSVMDFAREYGSQEIVRLLQNPPPSTKKPRKP